MAILLLALGALLSLPLTALGLPGSWLLLLGTLAWKWLDAAAGVSWTAIGIAFALATIAEVVEWTLGMRYATRAGGSPRAGWGALIGGIVGAVVGVPIPVLGSIVGSVLGAFAGALVAEYSVRRDHGHAGRVAWGAMVGRVLATAAKVGLGVVIAVVLLASAIG
jgi:uncharacterized protein